MKVITTTELSNDQEEFIYSLWNSEYPVPLCFQNIDGLRNYFSTLAGLQYYFLINDLHDPEGWAFTFNRDDESWFAITVNSKAHGRGKGSFLLNALKEHERNLNGWVIDHNNDVKQNGEPYASPLNFYLKNGFTVFPESRLEIPILSTIKIAWQRKD
jgi:GNAT superfamily N-acetyltransferase